LKAFFKVCLDKHLYVRPVSRRIPPPRQPETYRAAPAGKKCGAPPQPKFASVAAAEFFTVRRRRGGFHELLLHLEATIG